MWKLDILRGDESVNCTLSGRITGEQLPELRQALLRAVAGVLSLNLKGLKLVDRRAVRFLAECETAGVRLENCPAYVREWMEREGCRAAGEIG